VPVLAQGTFFGGRYRILRHLGSGGMASVLLCRDERLGRLVAVKRLHADQPEDVCRRFLREAKLGASLNHPNIVSVYDTATDDACVLIVMEYVRGEALSRALRRGPLPPGRVALMANEVGGALDHAHRQGVVHRDVKPGNVLLRDDGVAKLADLGIATAAGHTRITRTGVLLGTASYMAPEQLEGREAGPAADVYALAAVCFEALTGGPARSGRTPMEVAAQIGSEPPPDLRRRWADAPAAAAELLRRGMAREPGERPNTAGELGEGLRRALEKPPTAVTRPMMGGKPAPRGPERRAETAGRRPRLAAPLLAAALVVLAVATIAIALGSGGGRDAPSSGVGAQREERAQAPGERKDKAKEPKSEESAPQPAQPAPQEEPSAPAPAPAPEPEEDEEQVQPPPGPDPAEGARLNDQGFQLMGQGRFDEAIPILQRAVDSFPPGTGDLSYAYALFNLGRSLRLAGRPDEAIPILEQRLAIPNQRGVVLRELELARMEAGRR
jgi:eukaryotic-like serine/threonine-protein kinase